jgi:DNA-directed RNA polymerase subunit RPC12/RpoP
MSSFSPAQGFNLINAFWERVFARCPHDGGTISSHLYSAVGGYLLVLACDHCGRKIQVTRFSDPKRGSFRRWTAEEREKLLAACAGGTTPKCPVCQARIHRQGKPGALMVVECPRCGNLHEAMAHEPALAHA